MGPGPSEQGELFGDRPAADGFERRQAEQLAAIRAPVDRHLKIVAGPGAGKTHVLVERVRHLVSAGQAAGRIAVITYTNSARDELAGRLALALGDRDLPFAGTIHQFCLRLVQQQPELLGLSGRVRVLDPVAAERLFQSRSAPPGSDRRLFADLSLAWDRWDGSGPEPLGPPAASWRRFDRLLRRLGLATFTSLQLWALQCIEAGVGPLPEQVLVDEYQDTTGLQVRVLSALARRGARICVVGDPDQSIFRFAGADPSQLPDFERRFAPSEQRVLAANGRSSGAIVELAGLLRAGPGQFALRPRGRRPRLIHVESETRQAEVVADEIAGLLAGGRARPGQVAVLFREGPPVALAAALEGRGIPVFSPRSERFETRPHVRNLIVALEALAEPEDERAQFFLFDQLLRGGPKTFQTVMAALPEAGGFDPAIRAARQRVARPRQAALGQLLACRAELAVIGALADPAQRVIAIWDRLLAPRASLRERSQADEIQADLARIAAVAGQWPDPLDLAGWLRQGGLAPESPAERVTLASLHFAKGREWPVVFLVDLTRGVLPHRRNPDVDEERRLLHVGVSRAGERLVLVAPWRLPGRGEGPSPLLGPLIGHCRVSDLRRQTP